MSIPGPLNPTSRILMGPGPSNVHPRILQAMALPTLGHLDPEFVRIMDDTKAMLKAVMQTENELTLPVSGTGSAGQEACVANMVEPGDRCVVCIHGVFGGRLADMVARNGGEVVKVEAPWGQPIDPAAVEAALNGGKTKLVAIVHAETSTGVLQPLEEISRIVHEHGALFLVDTVTSLGGHPVKVDEWGIDACYSGTQKCLGIPPGLSPISFSDRAIAALEARRSKVSSWYLDMTMVRNYWGQDRTYHHTAPINAIYGLYEGLRIILEEGLEQRWARHKANHDLLVAKLAELGMSLLPEERYSLWSLNAVRIPEGVDDMAVRKTLLSEFDIEIGGGLGDLKGKVWRVGLMGYTSSRNNVILFIEALKQALNA
jgi:alanine-glyoxylate transaminase / serine-glyoxylate transaminase / serine-pyruvate transaminase